MDADCRPISVRTKVTSTDEATFSVLIGDKWPYVQVEGFVCCPGWRLHYHCDTWVRLHVFESDTQRRSVVKLQKTGTDLVWERKLTSTPQEARPSLGGNRQASNTSCWKDQLFVFFSLATVRKRSGVTNDVAKSSSTLLTLFHTQPATHTLFVCSARAPKLMTHLNLLSDSPI